MSERSVWVIEWETASGEWLRCTGERSAFDSQDIAEGEARYQSARSSVTKYRATKYVPETP